MPIQKQYLEPYRQGTCVEQVRRFPGCTYFKWRSGTVTGMTACPLEEDSRLYTAVFDIHWNDGSSGTYAVRTPEELRCFRIIV